MGKQVRVGRAPRLEAVPEVPEAERAPEVQPPVSAAPQRREALVSVTLKLRPEEHAYLLRTAMERRIEAGFGQVDMSAVAREIVRESMDREA